MEVFSKGVYASGSVSPLLLLITMSPYHWSVQTAPHRCYYWGRSTSFTLTWRARAGHYFCVAKRTKFQYSCSKKLSKFRKSLPFTAFSMVIKVGLTLLFESYEIFLLKRLILTWIFNFFDSSSFFSQTTLNYHLWVRIELRIAVIGFANYNVGKISLTLSVFLPWNATFFLL